MTQPVRNERRREEQGASEMKRSYQLDPFTNSIESFPPYNSPVQKKKYGR